MKLFYRKYGEGTPIIILHGLYGASDNWVKIAKELAKKYEVFLPDMRNHGNSPHSDNFSIEEMKKDLFEFVSDNKINDFILIGHSLGGKVSMEFASFYPEKIKKLVIVDIAPRNYTKDEFQERDNHSKIISMLKDVDLSEFKNRAEALEKMSSIDKTNRLKFFMMKNIRLQKDGSMSWKINIKAIADNLSTVLNEFSVDLSKISCPTLFVKGESSNYLTENDFANINKQMQKVQFCMIKDATHWLHSEKPEEFLSEINGFLSNNLN